MSFHTEPFHPRLRCLIELLDPPNLTNMDLSEEFVIVSRQYVKWEAKIEVTSGMSLFGNHSVIVSLLRLSSHSLPLAFIPHHPSLAPSANSLPAATPQQAYTPPSGPAITITIKRYVIAELRAMSSILQTSLPVENAGPIVLMVLYHIE